jgi:hypothetical protein
LFITVAAWHWSCWDKTTGFTTGDPGTLESPEVCLDYEATAQTQVTSNSCQHRKAADNTPNANRHNKTDICQPTLMTTCAALADAAA